MNAKQILMGGRELVAKGWKQGAFAADADGVAIAIDSREACQFCPLGALWRMVAGGFALDSEFERVKARNWLKAALPGKFSLVESFNDHPDTTQEDVLSLFDRAIALCS